MNDLPQYRSSVQDALGRVVPDDGDLRVWLDDDVVDRAAPDGWLHLVTAREACFLLLTERVVELSLDNDLGHDRLYGRGVQVIDFLVHQHGAHDRYLWPRDGITIHTANPQARDAMERAILRHAGGGVSVTKTYTPNTQPRFFFQPG